MKLFADEPRRGLRCVAPILLGGLLFSLLDGFIGLKFRPGQPLRGGSELSAYVLQIAGEITAIGLVAALALAVIDAALGRLRWRASGTAWVLAILAAVAVEWLNLGLFSGGGIHDKPYRPALEWGFRIVAPIATAFGVLVLSRMDARRWLALPLVGLACAVLHQNATKYSGLYLDVHLQLAGLAFALLVFAAHVALTRTRVDPGRSWIVTAILVLLAFGGIELAIHGRKVGPLKKGWDRAAQAVANRPQGFAQLTDLAAPLMRVAGRKGPEVAEAVNVTDLVNRLAPQLSGGTAMNVADRANIAKELDQRLPNRRKLNVLWLAIDTLRGDHCGFLGYPRKTTPTLDRIAEDAFVFEHAYTPYPTSNYAFSATLTSLAARISLVFGKKYNRPYEYHPLHSFPALVKTAGFMPCAVTSFDRDDLQNIRLFLNLKDGFDVFNPDQTDAAPDGAYIADSTIKVLRGHLADKAKPFFLWSHLIDPHAPYVRHPEFDFGKENIDEYDSEVAFSDHAAGRILDELAAQDRLKDTIIVLFADHGEEFNEHGFTTHGTTVYEEQIHVPLLIRIPGIKGHRVKTNVSLMDLVPTMTELLAVKDPVRRLGRSLLPLMFGSDEKEGGIVYSEVFGIRSEQHVKDRRAVIFGRRKLIYRVQENTFELYDLDRDARERQSLIGRGEADEGTLRGWLEAWDKTIDTYFGTAAAESRPVKDEIESLLGKITDPDQKVARPAAEQIYQHLFNSYGELQPKTLASISMEQMDAVFDRLAEVYPKLKGLTKIAVLSALARRESPRFADLFKRQLKQGGESTLLACTALAAIGDDAGKELLEAAVDAPQLPNKSDVGWSLIRLGSPKALDWFYMDLMSVKFGRPLRETILSLPRMRVMVEAAHNDKLPPPTRILRDRVFEEPYRHPEVNRAIVDAMRNDESEDAKLILLRLARNEEEDIRDRARAALALVMTPADLDKNLSAQDDEMAADDKLLNGQWLAAVEKYESALARGTLKNVGARFRMARALHFAAAGPDAAAVVAKARSVLDEIEKLATIPMDKSLVARRREELAWPRDVDGSKLKFTVLDHKVPEYIKPGDWFSMSLRLRNDGPQPWYGGWCAGSVELCVRFIGPDGKLHETQREKNVTNRFLEHGVLPGEETTINLLGVGMPAAKKEGDLTVLFRNTRARYAGDGIVFRKAWKSNEPESAPTTKRSGSK